MSSKNKTYKSKKSHIIAFTVLSIVVSYFALIMIFTFMLFSTITINYLKINNRYLQQEKDILDYEISLLETELEERIIEEQATEYIPEISTESTQIELNNEMSAKLVELGIHDEEDYTYVHSAQVGSILNEEGTDYEELIFFIDYKDGIGNVLASYNPETNVYNEIQSFDNFMVSIDSFSIVGGDLVFSTGITATGCEGPDWETCAESLDTAIQDAVDKKQYGIWRYNLSLDEPQLMEFIEPTSY